MDEAEDVGGKRLWRLIRIVALSLALVFLLGMAGGFIAANLEEGDGFSLVEGLILAAILLAFAACAWLMLRDLRRPTGEEPLTRKERLNRNILVGCALLGLVVGIAMTIGGGGESLTRGGGLLSNDPLPGGLVLALVAVLGVLLPILSIFWHRSAIDELEADAYKTGALYAVYVYMIGAPIWWLLWRGGFVPAPNGIVIYFAVILTLGAVWMHKKHG
jgi:hypothetical protein